MATDPKALEAQANVLRLLAPDLCRLVDSMLEEVSAADTPVDGRNFCPCGQIIWEDDWEDFEPHVKERLIDEAAAHECAWTRMLRAWTSST